MDDLDVGGIAPAPDSGHPVGATMADLVARIAVDVQSCPLIAGLHGGPLGQIVTLTGAGRLVGIRVDGDVVAVGVIGRAAADPQQLVDQVRAAVLACLPAARVDVSIVAGLDPRTGTVVDGGAPR